MCEVVRSHKVRFSNLCWLDDCDIPLCDLDELIQGTRNTGTLPEVSFAWLIAKIREACLWFPTAA